MQCKCSWDSSAANEETAYHDGRYLRVSVYQDGEYYYQVDRGLPSAAGFESAMEAKLAAEKAIGVVHPQEKEHHKAKPQEAKEETKPHEVQPHKAKAEPPKANRFHPPGLAPSSKPKSSKPKKPHQR